MVYVEQTAAEAKQLRTCINDLIGIVALPAIWSGSAPTEIARTLPDMLVSMLRLDFVYLQLKHSAGEPSLEVVRSPRSHAVTGLPREIGDLLKSWSSGHRREWPRLVRNVFGDEDLSIIPLPLGLEGEIGILVAGSRRADFPVRTERLLLSVAANQAAVWLQGARLLSEQKRVAEELDQKVAQRTEELAATNRELRKEIAKEHSISLENARLYRNLEDRERRIRRLVDANILGIFIWDMEGAIVEANEAFLHMLQYGSEDVASGRLRWADLTPPEWRERDERALAELKASGMVEPYEKEYFRRDGSRVPVLVAGALFEEGGGEGVAFALDLSEQKRSEETHRIVVETASDAVLTVDDSGLILFTNPASKRIFGYDPTELIGKPLTILMPEYMRKIHEAGFKRYLATGRRHLNWQGTELIGLRKNGEEFPMEVAFGEQIRNGHKTFTGFVRDIGEKKRAEDALRSSQAYLVEAQSLTHTGSCAIDGKSHATVYWSDEMFRLFGFDPKQGLPMFDQWLQRIHPEDREKLKLANERTFLNKVTCDVEFRIVKPDGTVKHIHGIGHPVLSPTGELAQVVGTMVDVTERKRAEEARDRLRQLEADLAHINRVSTMGELAASLAHEIKQPIGAAVTNAEACLRLLDRDHPDLPEAREAALEMAKDARRAADIIDRVRSLYQKGSPHLDVVDVNELIREMVIVLNNEANRHSATMRTDLAEGLPTVMADRVQLQQALMNLMLNGIEAMRDTSGELSIKSRLAEDHQLLISVTDTGVGLPAENIDKLFNAFFTTKYQGTGLGLPITRSIVESHSGRIWATANSGAGATFHFTLPSRLA